jgi:hypothetical protein
VQEEEVASHQPLVGEDEPLESVLGNAALRRLGALIATDPEGRIRGVLTVDAIGKALRPTKTGLE